MTPEHVDAGVVSRGCVGTRFAYYGGQYDGRVSTLDVMHIAELETISAGATSYGYTVTRAGVHSDAETLCWVLFMHTPIAERGKL